MSQKKTYTVRFDVVESWKASFEAESEEEAKQLFKDFAAGEITGEELPEYFEKNIGIDTDFAYGLEDEAGNQVELPADEA